MKDSPKSLARLQEENDDQITLRQTKVESQLSRPLVIDLGTYSTKVGFAASTDMLSNSNECFPQLMIPTIVGYPKLVSGRLGETTSSANFGSSYVGFEALRRST